MFSHIEKLQQKPRETRKQIAFFVAIIVTGVVFLFWLNNISTIKRPRVVETTKTDSPLEVVEGWVSESANSIKGSVGDIPNP